MSHITDVLIALANLDRRVVCFVLYRPLRFSFPSYIFYTFRRYFSIVRGVDFFELTNSSQSWVLIFILSLGFVISFVVWRTSSCFLNLSFLRIDSVGHFEGTCYDCYSFWCIPRTFTYSHGNSQ